MLLNYSDDGPGPVVVLIHGFPLDHTMWESQIQTVGSTYRVIAPDLRGHGRSASPEGDYTIDAMADDVLETLDALELTERVVVAGMSMGGYVALSLVLRYPQRFRGLALVNTRAGADTPETARVREELAQTVEAQGHPEAVVATMLGKLFSPTTAARRPDLIARTRETMMATKARGVAGALRGMATRPDRTADLARITLPTQVLVGLDDQLIPVTESHKLAQGIPGAQLVELPDAGHMAPLENPGDFDAAFLSFLNGLPT